MTTNAQIFIVILVSAGCTFLLRALPFLVFGGGRQMPAWLERLGQTLPAAIMAVLIVYCLKDVMTDWAGGGIQKLAAVFITALTYKWKHNTFLSIITGTVSYMLLMRLL